MPDSDQLMSINSGYLETYGAIKQFQWNCLFTVLNDCAVSEMSGTSQQIAWG